MEKLIHEFQVSKLPNERLYNFAQIVDDQFGQVSIPQISMVYNNFHTAVQDFKLKLEPVHYKKYTRLITEKDQSRDKVFSAFHVVVMAYLDSPVAAEADAADMLKSVFDKYKGIQRQDYKQESGALINFIEELETHHQQNLSTLHLTEWLQILKTLNQEFATLYSNRDVEERAYFSYKDVTASRQAVIENYRELIAHFEAAVLMGMSMGNSQTIAQNINEYIDREIISLNVAKGRKQSKKEKENAGENTSDNTGSDNTDPNQGEDNTPSANA